MTSMSTFAVASTERTDSTTKVRRPPEHVAARADARHDRADQCHRRTRLATADLTRRYALPQARRASVSGGTRLATRRNSALSASTCATRVESCASRARRSSISATRLGELRLQLLGLGGGADGSVGGGPAGQALLGRLVADRRSRLGDLLAQRVDPGHQVVGGAGDRGRAPCRTRRADGRAATPDPSAARRPAPRESRPAVAVPVPRPDCCAASSSGFELP